MARLLLAGLISPAIVLVFLIASLFLTGLMGLTFMLRLVIVSLAVMVGFILGSILIVRLSDRILNFAKVKRKC